MALQRKCDRRSSKSQPRNHQSFSRRVRRSGWLLTRTTMFDQPQAWLTQIPRDQIVSESRQRRKLAANFRPAGAARTATAALEAAEQDRSHTSLSDISQPSNFYAPSQLMSSRIRKRGWLSPVSSQVFQCLIFGCLLLRSNVAQVTPPVGANARLFNPVMRWGRQILFACDKYTEVRMARMLFQTAELICMPSVFVFLAQLNCLPRMSTCSDICAL